MYNNLRLLCFGLLFFVSLMCNSLFAQEFLGIYWDKDNNPQGSAVLNFGYSNWGTEEEPEIVWVVSIETLNSNEVVETIFFSENTKWQYDEFIMAGSDKMENVFSLIKSGEDILYQFFYLDSGGKKISTINFMIHSKEGQLLYFAGAAGGHTGEVVEEYYQAIKDAIRTVPFSKRR